ncbi:VanZ family protein [Agaribacterium haliotis]|uniref:VanZ family protein n=1 Tax=Agaribacterium haliotis TaxID=2013869 RepID=UPI000BB5456D|nr:VanZ family protein [Agaribacterium haliotis]
MHSKLALLHSPVFKFLRRAQLALAMLIYCVLLLLPQQKLQGASFNDLWLHGVGNFLLFCSLWLAFDDKPRRIYLLLFTISFSALMELVQSLGSRSGSWSDLAANSGGAFVAFLFCALLDLLFDYWDRRNHRL